jgi:hypothetical protein
MRTEDGSKTFQAEAGKVQGGTGQLFHSITTAKNSTVAQGRVDGASFEAMFGKR